jgi:hypothetical protein
MDQVVIHLKADDCMLYGSWVYEHDGHCSTSPYRPDQPYAGVLLTNADAGEVVNVCVYGVCEAQDSSQEETRRIPSDFVSADFADTMMDIFDLPEVDSGTK